MSIVISIMIAGSAVLPDIDRRALDLQARAEALRPAHRTMPARRAGVRRASGGEGLNLSSITTICRAAGNQADPARFLDTLAGAYSMSPEDGASLRASCAAYLAGQADARRAGRTR